MPPATGNASERSASGTRPQQDGHGRVGRGGVPGLALFVIGIIAIFAFFAFAASQGSLYSS